ncbi:2,3-bisphosphoglycerate-dependent phosphoglycerate mutase [Quillaja saponaria]|uniref:2,3-bisphosphoglycerate-dependent phosphoglycerate mutase n=1 Tax=Quillaja saponaria TaxID=32244 RepID=A0AAD7L4V7_QUISA|nr:2,3-bisphosphoglycerate-dependent phosphoglycerate mutase [Quillaja saponaria]
MSVKKSLSLNNGKEVIIKGDDQTAKRSRYDRCFSFMEISVEPGKQLKEMDSNKLKNEIKRWAKAVVAYARQVSDHFGSSHGKSQRE